LIDRIHPRLFIKREEYQSMRGQITACRAEEINLGGFEVGQNEHRGGSRN
jgi:hypothetical protein